MDEECVLFFCSAMEEKKSRASTQNASIKIMNDFFLFIVENFPFKMLLKFILMMKFSNLQNINSMFEYNYIEVTLNAWK